MRTVGSAGTMGTTARAAQAKNKFEQIVFEIEEFTEHVPVRDALVVVRWVRTVVIAGATKVLFSLNAARCGT